MRGTALAKRPHRAFVTIEAMAAYWEFEVLARHFVALQRVVEHLTVGGDDRLVVLGVGKQRQRRARTASRLRYSSAWSSCGGSSRLRSSTKRSKSLVDC